MYAKALESLQEFGFVAPIVARTSSSGYEIIDGEHRWKAAGDLGVNPIPVFVVDGLSDAKVKKLTVVLNELRGQARPDLLAELLKELQSELGEDLLTGLPYTDDILKSFVDLPALPALTPESLSQPPGSGSGVQPKERWVERLYRMPADAAEVLDEALAKAKGDPRGNEMADWQALELIAADFLAS